MRNPLILCGLLCLLVAPLEASLVQFAVISTTGSVDFGNSTTINGTVSSAGDVGAQTTILFGNGANVTGNGTLDSGSLFAAQASGTAITIGGGGTPAIAGDCNTGGGSVSGSGPCASVETTGAQLGPYNTAVTEANALLAAIPTQPADQTFATLTNGNTVTGVSGMNFVDVDTISLPSSNDILTFSGPSDAVIVVRVASLFSLGGTNSQIALGGSLPASNLLFYLGGATNLTGANGVYLRGTFLGTSTCSSGNSFDLDGAIVCAGNISLTNSPTINSMPFPYEVALVPEPGTYALTCIGLLGLLYFRRRKLRPVQN